MGTWRQDKPRNYRAECQLSGHGKGEGTPGLLEGLNPIVEQQAVCPISFSPSSRCRIHSPKPHCPQSYSQF